MSISKDQAEKVAAIAFEVIQLARKVTREIDEEIQYDGKPRHAGGTAYGSASLQGGSIATAALKRRSMDLTRALAVMRGAN